MLPEHSKRLHLPAVWDETACILQIKKLPQCTSEPTSTIVNHKLLVRAVMTTTKISTQPCYWKWSLDNNIRAHKSLHIWYTVLWESRREHQVSNAEQAHIPHKPYTAKNWTSFLSLTVSV